MTPVIPHLCSDCYKTPSSPSPAFRTRRSSRPLSTGPTHPQGHPTTDAPQKRPLRAQAPHPLRRWHLKVALSPQPLKPQRFHLALGRSSLSAVSVRHSCEAHAHTTSRPLYACALASPSLTHAPFGPAAHAEPEQRLLGNARPAGLRSAGRPPLPESPFCHQPPPRSKHSLLLPGSSPAGDGQAQGWALVVSLSVSTQESWWAMSSLCLWVMASPCSPRCPAPGSAQLPRWLLPWWEDLPLTLLQCIHPGAVSQKCGV